MPFTSLYRVSASTITDHNFNRAVAGWFNLVGNTTPGTFHNVHRFLVQLPCYRQTKRRLKAFNSVLDFLFTVRRESSYQMEVFDVTSVFQVAVCYEVILAWKRQLKSGSKIYHLLRSLVYHKKIYKVSWSRLSHVQISTIPIYWPSWFPQPES